MKVKEGTYQQQKSERKGQNLVIQTHLDNSFDNRWAEVKIQGKNIPARSNHAAAVFSNFLYVHGGYDVDRGIIPDFHCIDITLNCEEYLWTQLDNTYLGKPIKLKSHTAVVYQDKLAFFGGESQTGISSNLLYIYDVRTKSWSVVQPTINVPKVDSHCAVINESKMYVFGGYLSEEATNLRDMYAYDFSSSKWEVVWQGGKQGDKEPEGRSNSALVALKNNLLLFGGTNGVKTLNDFWSFEITTKTWKSIDCKNSPEPRRGHSMVLYEDSLFLFGGIQDITKEKNDVYIYSKGEWSKIQTNTNSVYDCSPTLKREQKARPLQIVSAHRISPEKSPEKGEIAMKKILIENKQKKFQERKKELLRQFAERPPEANKKRDFSPTTQSMVKTLETIGNQQPTRKEPKQEIVYDETHRYIIGKKPCARDGQSVNVHEGVMLIFGGDRHLMAFNDLYQFDLAKGLKSLSLYSH